MGEKNKRNVSFPGNPSRKHGKMDIQLQMARFSLGTRCRVSLTGELRHGNTEKVLNSVEELCESGFTDVLLDLGRLTYCDTAGLETLVQIYKFVKEKEERKIEIFAGDGMVMQTLRTCRFDRFLNITEDASSLEGDWKAI